MAIKAYGGPEVQLHSPFTSRDRNPGLGGPGVGLDAVLLGIEPLLCRPQVYFLFFFQCCILCGMYI
jgi:hypothetical protein